MFDVIKQTKLTNMIVLNASLKYLRDIYFWNKTKAEFSGGRFIFVAVLNTFGTHYFLFHMLNAHWPSQARLRSASIHINIELSTMPTMIFSLIPNIVLLYRS